MKTDQVGSRRLRILLALLVASPLLQVGCRDGSRPTSPGPIDTLVVDSTLANSLEQPTILRWSASFDGSSEIGAFSMSPAAATVRVLGVQAENARLGNHTLALTILDQVGNSNGYRASGVQVQLIRSHVSTGRIEVLATRALPDEIAQLAAGQSIVFEFSL